MELSSAFSAGLSAGLAAVVGLGVAVHPARGDDDDQKLKDRKPVVIGPIVRAPGTPGFRRAPGGPDASFPSKNVILKSWIPLNNFPGFAGASQHTAADCWGYTSPSGREYALIGVGWGTGVVEVTDPANPVIVAVVPGTNSLWHDTAVIGHYAYTVSDSSGVGIQVINLQNVDAGVVTHVGNIMQGGHTTTHTLLDNPASGFLYACGGNANGGGMIPVSTANPQAPSFTGPGWNSSYVHEAQIVTYTSGPYAGKEIAFLFAGGGGIAIVDITNKLAPAQLSWISYPATRYTHQGWISEDRQYLYVDDELDGPDGGTGWFSGTVPYSLTRVFDISNLSAPRMVATFSNGIASIDHNQYVRDGYLYQSNYTSGMRVWDLSDPLRPVEVAWIDTRPEDDGATFNGNWGNYPYFNSGTVILSDLERGLFAVKVSLLTFEPTGPLPTALTVGQATPVTVLINERDATVDPASVKLMVSVNGGAFTAHAMSATGQGQYTGSIPPQACFARVRYYFTADTTDQRTFKNPLNAPAEAHSATAQTGAAVVFSDDFQTDKGWTVANTALTAGAWVRAVPAANGGQGAAVGDADGSGMAFVTGNGPDEDVDGGPTRLLSPAIDLSGAPEAVIRYARWVLSIQGVNDALVVEVSGNNGASWATVESVGPSSGAWRYHGFRVADFVTPSAQTRLRFSIADPGDDSMTEAGVDAVTVTSLLCVCYPDCNGDGTLNLADFGCFQTKFATQDPYADCNGDQVLNLADFGCFQTKFAVGCP